MRSGTTLPAPKGPVIIEVTIEDTPVEEETIPTPQPTTVAKTPPFPQRLAQPLVLVENRAVGELLNQLKQITVKIPLLDVLKEIPAYTKAIKKACIKQPSRKRKEP